MVFIVVNKLDNKIVSHVISEKMPENSENNSVYFVLYDVTVPFDFNTYTYFYEDNEIKQVLNKA